MDTKLNEKSCTISAAAEAIGCGTETIRGWLSRGASVYLFTGNNGGWRRFFGVDIALMALAAPMIGFGIKPEFAFKMAREIITQKAAAGKPSWAEAKHLAAIFAGQMVLVRNDADRWLAELVSDHGRGLTISSKPTLVLNPGILIQEAFWRMEGENI